MASIEQAFSLKDDTVLKEFGYIFISNCAKALRKDMTPYLPAIVAQLVDTVKESEEVD